MVSLSNQQLRQPQQPTKRSSIQFQLMFLTNTDDAVDIIETYDIDLEEIIACIKLGGSVFITNTHNELCE
jgi:hypothetical protein